MFGLKVKLVIETPFTPTLYCQVKMMHIKVKITQSSLLRGVCEERDEGRVCKVYLYVNNIFMSTKQK